MRKLGEQWVEELDGKKHMLKAVEGPCERCDISHTCNLSVDCHMERGLIAKDLGILKNGVLPSPFPDGGYPTIQRGAHWGDEEWVFCYWAVYKAHKIYICTGQFPTEQEAIDAWNRRA